MASDSATSHESFLHHVRALAVARVPEEGTRTRLLATKLVYGIGRGYRGICRPLAWHDGDAHDLVEIAASGEESVVQLAGTTVHETAHVLAGSSAGHGATWKRACRVLGLTRALAEGQLYTASDFDAPLWALISSLSPPNDGVPTFSPAGIRSGVHAAVTRRTSPARALTAALSLTTSARPCPAGMGVRGGRSRGHGSGSRLRLWVCACDPPVKVRVASDTFAAHCDGCAAAFKRAQPRPRPIQGSPA
jgi:hypothetical protein